MIRYLLSISGLALIANNAAAQFTPLCTGTTNGFVVDFAEYQGETYATGFFNTICNKSTGFIAKWNGNDWEQGAMGGIDEGHALEVIGDALFIATYEFGVDSNYVLRWNGANLTTIGTVYRTSPNPNLQQNSSIYDIIEYQGDIVVCGEFNRTAGIVTPGISRWDGAGWDSLGSGLSGAVNTAAPILYPHQMVVFEDDLIVCGNFKSAGGQVVNGIARWNGQQWQPLGDGFNNTVYGIGVFNGVLYAGGAFTKSGTTTLGRIARWNGAAWENPGFGFEYSIAGLQAFIHTLKPVGDSLYIAGGFNKYRPLGGTTVNASGIVAINSAGAINLLGGGTPNIEIEAVIPFEDKVLVGGGASNGSGYVGVWQPGTSVTADIPGATLLKVSPNPFLDYISIEGIENTDYQTLTLKNMNGVTCFKTQLAAVMVTHGVDDLPAGMYLLEVGGSTNLTNFRQLVVKM